MFLTLKYCFFENPKMYQLKVLRCQKMVYGNITVSCRIYESNHL